MIITSEIATQPDVFLIWYATASGENDEMLGADESPIVCINWVAVEVVDNKIMREGTIFVREENDEEEDDEKSRVTLKEATKQIEELVSDLSGCSRTVRLVTENGLHLRQCLVPRAFQLDIKVPEFFLKYIDIRKEYRFFTGKMNSFKNLQEIAGDMGIEEQGLLAVGEDKCRFCARVTQYLLKEGHKFGKVESIGVTLNDGIPTGYVKDDTIARARGLPWQVSDVDVAEFFTGLNIAKGGVALCLNIKGRRNGEALVRFETTEHRDMALKRHKHHLLGRYIEVYKGTAQEFLKIAKGPATAMHAAAEFLTNGGEVIIRMRGLPFDATVQDITDFFGEKPQVLHGEEGVMLISYPDGSSTGDAFVLFETESEGQLALKKHRQNIGKRYVELFRSTRAELQQVLTMYNIGYQLIVPHPGQSPFPVISDRALINQRLQALMNMSCLRMRGLPFSASHKDIINFLGSYSDHIVGTVHVIFNLQGRPSGEAFVQLQTPDQAHQCSNERHLKHMGERYIEVFQCSVQDMTWMLATSHANQLASQQMNQINNPPTFHTQKNASFHTPSPTTLHTPSPPPPPPLIHTTSTPSMITPPPITSNGLLTPVSPIPIYTGQFPPMISPMPAGFIPPPHMQPAQGIPPPIMFNQEPVPFHLNQFGKPNGVAYITFAPPEDHPRFFHHHHHQPHDKYHKHGIGSRYVEMFYAH